MRTYTFLMVPLLGISTFLFGSDPIANHSNNITRHRRAVQNQKQVDPGIQSQYGPIFAAVSVNSSFGPVPQSIQVNLNWTSVHPASSYTLKVYGLQNWTDQPTTKINGQLSADSNRIASLSESQPLGQNVSTTSFTLYPRSNYSSYNYIVVIATGDDTIQTDAASTTSEYLDQSYLSAATSVVGFAAIKPKFSAATNDLSHIESQYGPIFNLAASEASLPVNQTGSVGFYVSGDYTLTATITGDNLVNTGESYSVGPGVDTIPVTFTASGLQTITLHCLGQNISTTVNVTAAQLVMKKK